MQRVPSTNYPEHNNEALGALGQVGQPASDLNQLASASGGDAAKPDESMADLIQQEAQISLTPQDQPDHGEELDQATLGGKVCSSFQKDAGCEKGDQLITPQPKSSSCPPPTDPMATKRITQQDAPPQHPPGQAAASEESKLTEEQRPDQLNENESPVPTK